MVEFKRKRGESFEAFLRRFKRALIRSQKLNEARKRQHLKPRLSKNKKKQYALSSKKLKEKSEYLRKIGKLEEDNRRRW